jgi:hypothetical protein
MKKAVMIGTILLLILSVGKSWSLVGNELYFLLSSVIPPKSYEAGYGGGYVMGVSDSYTLFMEAGLVDKVFEIPEGVDGKQVIGVVRHYLQKHPRARDLPAMHLVVEALKEEFPPS